MIALFGVLMLSGSMFFHTVEALDDWVDDWEVQVWQQNGLTYDLILDYLDMTFRHPCYFRDDCSPPPSHTHTRSTSTAPIWSGTIEQWRPLVAAYFRADEVDRAMRVLGCESKGNPSAKNPTSSASGLFQHLTKYWASRSAAAGWGGASVFDPTANVAVAAWLRDSMGWGSWVCR